MALTPKQSQFVAEYLVDLNATQAAIRAGYSEKTAYSIGQENLKKPEIADALQSAMEKRSERTQIDADYVLTGIQSIVEANRKERPDTALKGFELLGKHLELFTDKHKHGGDKDNPFNIEFRSILQDKKSQ